MSGMDKLQAMPDIILERQGYGRRVRPFGRIVIEHAGRIRIWSNEQTIAPLDDLAQVDVG